MTVYQKRKLKMVSVSRSRTARIEENRGDKKAGIRPFDKCRPEINGSRVFRQTFPFILLLSPLPFLRVSQYGLRWVGVC
jgi:hypothetical protein